MSNYGSTEWAPEHIRSLLLYSNGKLYIKCSNCENTRSTQGKKSLQNKLEQGKNIEYCKKCLVDLAVNVRRLTDEEEDLIQVRLNKKYYLKDGNAWVGKWCNQCEDFKPIRVSSLVSFLSYEGRIAYNARCVGCSKPGRYTHQGYVMILSKNHPFAQQSGYVAEHRLVMEKYLGRYLEAHETVHHVNGIRDDNRLSNLQLRLGAHGAGVAMSCRDCGSKNLKFDYLCQ